MTGGSYETLRAFLEDRDVSRRAAEPLKAGSLFAVSITGDPQPYHIIRESQGTRVRAGAAPGKPQVTFTISPGAIERLSRFDSDSIGEFGVEFFRLMMSNDPELVLDAKLHVGLIGLTRMGAFKILMAGGPSVMSYLARKGFRSLSEIRSAIKKASGD